MEISSDIRQMTAAAPAKARIASDFDTFLRMLTAQMKNQDPLNPVEAIDFATQLATFSGVEQAVLTNDLLRSLSAQMQVTGLADISNWIGKEVRAPAAAYFDGNPITLHPDPMVFADGAEVVVRDSSGYVVQRFAVPATDDPIQWQGIGANGQMFPQDRYSFTLVNLAGEQEIGESAIDTYARVAEVRSMDGQMQLILKGGVIISAADVTALRDAGR
jgi:flagellar basal-body rod modification protein FlgD